MLIQFLLMLSESLLSVFPPYFSFITLFDTHSRNVSIDVQKMHSNSTLIALNHMKEHQKNFKYVKTNIAYHFPLSCDPQEKLQRCLYLT